MSFGARISILGLAFVVLLTVLTLRLWSIQVVQASQFVEQAENNQLKVIETPAPRGEIRDRKGRLLAGTRPALAAVVDGALLPNSEDPTLEDLIQRLSAFATLPVEDVRHALDDARLRGEIGRAHV